MNIIQFLVPDKYYSELLFNLLKTMPYVKGLKSYDIKEDEYSNSTMQDMDAISLYTVGNSFNNLGTDEDFKDWINAPTVP